MKILIDESLPRYTLQIVQGYEAYTVQYMGWGGTKNGELLSRAEGNFDVFLTADKNLQHQQNMTGRSLAIVVFPSNKLSVVKKMEMPLKHALQTIAPSMVVEL
jgi:predicted nuclease of predicted toxin-antitoxin system